jgi:hypothetical protein
MQGHYAGLSCLFESKDLIDVAFDELYPGREVRPNPSAVRV